MSLQTFKVWLDMELKKRDWSYRELARQANGYASHTLTVLVFKGERPVTWNYCAAIAEALDYSPIEVFKVAGLLDGNGNGSDIPDRVARMAQKLPEDKQADLLKYAEFLTYK